MGASQSGREICRGFAGMNDGRFFAGSTQDGKNPKTNAKAAAGCSAARFLESETLRSE